MSSKFTQALVVAFGVTVLSCGSQEAPEASAPKAAPVVTMPPLDATNIVSLALDSPDHTTLVAALKAANYVTSAAASGPLTVFAPTNAAFDALPAGVLEGLLKPDAADDLRNILKYHVMTSSYATSTFKDGQVMAMANGKKVTIGVKDGKYTVNGANIVASAPASNGMLHIIDAVLLPPSE